MKLKFMVVDVYNTILNKSSIEYNLEEYLEETNKIGKIFLSKYSKEINKIVKLLPKITRKRWPKCLGNEIEVYFVKYKGPSFAYPLTLKVRGDLLFMLVILTHELGHRFFDGYGSEKDINDLTEKVFEKLKINTKKQIALIRTFNNSTNKLISPNFL